MFGKQMFPGGVHPHEGVGGKAANQGNAIREMPAPRRVIIPLSMHIGAPARPVVQKGDHVLMGQVIAEAGGFVSAPIHASVSGTVLEIGEAQMPNGAIVRAILIDNDFRDEWVELHPCGHPETLTPAEAQQVIREAGIVGMGGAAFPTAVKLTPAPGKVIEKLILNGAECEPYLTADHRLMLEKAVEIVDGLRLVMLAFGVKDAIIGIEDNKPDAIAAMRAAAKPVDGIRVQALPVRYPQGGEKQLIYALTRRVVPNGGLPLDVGCVVCNVGTMYAIDQAIREGRPLVQRVTTIGGLVQNPGNYLVRIGTPVRHLLDACGGLRAEAKMLVSGGPMMGQAFNNLETPVTKGTSGIIALGADSLDPDEGPCIRCGRCMRACPMKLLPVHMDHFIREFNYNEAERLGVMNCIECGACTYVCPAKRLLTQSFRMGKKVITARRKAAAELAKKEKEEAERERAAREAAEKKEG